MEFIQKYPLSMARVSFMGVTRIVCTECVDAKIGDYVIVHAGVAISVVDKSEIENIIADLKRLADLNESYNHHYFTDDPNLLKRNIT